MQNNFSALGISPEILKAIQEMGFVEPTEVQSESIPTILNHEDVIVMSKTGSGKTAVFGIPMLQMTDPTEAGPQGLILTPTRELAVQVDSDLKLMSKYLEHQTAVVYGQHSMNVEVQALKKGVTIVTGTPGRVFDHLQHGNLNTKHIRFLVLDEADRMLDMGFLNQVVRIIKSLPKNRVTLLFSATIPTEIQRISRDFMNNPVMIEIESKTMTVDTIRQIYYRLNRNEKQTQLNRILLAEQPESCMIFCNTRVAVDQVQRFLTKKGYASQSLHGDIAQARRIKTIDQFKQGVFHILVATDVAARGIHIDSLSLVINYDVPLEKDGYVHRIGRTGRAGNEGLAITLVTSDDIMSLYAIEEHTGAMIVEAELPTDAYLDELKESSEKWIQANSNILPEQQLIYDNNNSRSSGDRNSDSRARNGSQSGRGSRSGQGSSSRNGSRSVQGSGSGSRTDSRSVENSGSRAVSRSVESSASNAISQSGYEPKPSVQSSSPLINPDSITHSGSKTSSVGPSANSKIHQTPSIEKSVSNKSQTSGIKKPSTKSDINSSVSIDSKPSNRPHHRSFGGDVAETEQSSNIATKKTCSEISTPSTSDSSEKKTKSLSDKDNIKQNTTGVVGLLKRLLKK